MGGKNLYGYPIWRFREPEYTEKKTIIDYLGGWNIVRLETKDRKFNEIRYSSRLGNSEIDIIIGYLCDSDWFHIRKFHAEPDLLHMFEMMQEDLKERGVRYLTYFTRIREHFNADGFLCDQYNDPRKAKLHMKNIPWDGMLLEKRLF